MTFNTPRWLDTSFLTLALNGKLNQEESDLVISSFQVSSLLPPGNNYSSDLIRVEVTYKKNNEICKKSLVVKALTGFAEFAKLFDKLYEKEPTFYNKYVPEALKFTPDLPVCKTFFSSIPDVLVFEDLKEEGYMMADRLKMLDFDHCKLFFTASAVFHATSVAVHKEDPDIVESIAVDPMYSKDLAGSSVRLHKRLMVDGLSCMADSMERIEEYKKYAKLVRESTGTIWDEIVELHKPKYNINVLQQGDAWTPNMMFKYDTFGKVSDIKLLDFQAIRYSSPICSLIFFLWTSANHEVREQRLEELYHIYCDVLNEKLRELKCSERLYYDEFQKDLRALSPAVMAIAAYFFPSITSSITSTVETIIKSLEEGTENHCLKYYNEQYCDGHFRRILGQLEKHGVFDVIGSCT